jgi:hypothetical protein
MTGNILGIGNKPILTPALSLKERVQAKTAAPGYTRKSGTQIYG